LKGKKIKINKMKKIITIAILAIAMNAVAQVPAWQWAKKEGGLNSDMGNSIAMDASGNTYVLGSSASLNITFDSIVLTNPSGSGAIDMFIVKYNISRKVAWVKSVDCASGTNIAVDAAGNCYITGQFSCSVITFGSVSLTNSAGLSADMFIVKYDTNGNVVWAKSAGGVGINGTNTTCVGVDIAVDANENPYVTGYFYGPDIIFGSDTLINVAGIGNDMFIVKYDASGTVVWAKSAGGSTYDLGNCIVTDINGNNYVGGNFYGTITFGSTTLTSAGDSDAFIVKYDASGTALWAKSIGGGKGDGGGSRV